MSHRGDAVGSVSRHEALGSAICPAQEPCLHHRKSPLSPNLLACPRILSESANGLRSKLRVVSEVIRFLFGMGVVFFDLCSFPRLEKESVEIRSENSRVLPVPCSCRQDARARSVFLARGGHGHKPRSDAVLPVIIERSIRFRFQTLNSSLNLFEYKRKKTDLIIPIRCSFLFVLKLN